MMILEFSDHFYSYEVISSDRTSLYRFSDLVHHDALNIKVVRDRRFVNEKLVVEFHTPGL